MLDYHPPASYGVELAFRTASRSISSGERSARPVGDPRFHLADRASPLLSVPVTQDPDDDLVGVAVRLGIGSKGLEARIAGEPKLVLRVERGGNIGARARNPVGADVPETVEIRHGLIGLRGVGGKHERERKRKLGEQIWVRSGEVNRDGASRVVDLDPFPQVTTALLRGAVFSAEDPAVEGWDADARST